MKVKVSHNFGMPYRRRRRYKARRGYTKGQRGGRPTNIVSSYAKYGALGEWGSYKLDGLYSLNADTSGLLNVGFRITQPDLFDATNALTDWTSVANLYDSFRVVGIKLRFYPAVPNDESTTTLYTPAFVFADFDSVGLNPTNAAAVGYGNCKVVNLMRPWKYYLKVPKLMNATSSTIASPGWMDTASPAATGGLYVNQSTSSLLTASRKYGIIRVTYYIRVHNRK